MGKFKAVLSWVTGKRKQVTEPERRQLDVVRSQDAQGKLPPHGTGLSTHADIKRGARPDFAAKVEAIYSKVRADYREGLGSGNKGYIGSDPGKRSASVARELAAHKLISENRPPANSTEQDFLEFRRGILQRIPAGNCGELSSAAMDHANEAGLSARVWAFGVNTSGMKLEHRVTVVAATRADLREIMAEDGLGSAAANRAWAVDPWMDLCCPLDQYPTGAEEKMHEWSKADEGIRNGVDGALVNPVQPDWIDAIRSFPHRARVATKHDRPLYVLERLVEHQSRGSESARCVRDPVKYDLDRDAR
jgi:hypothetical protein